MNGGGEVVLYEAPDGQIRLDVRLEQDTVWLTQAQMAELFGKNVRTVSEHIRNVFNERELDDSSVIWNFRITARYGRVYETQFYNLDSKGRDVAGRQAVRRLGNSYPWSSESMKGSNPGQYAKNAHCF
jgi:hypothetical protein